MVPEKDIDNTLKLLARVDETSRKCYGKHLTSITGLYGELYVFNKLRRLGPKLGDKRPNGNKISDIFIPKKGSKKSAGVSVEVKYSTWHDEDGVDKQMYPASYEHHWGWQIGENQKENVDFIILLAGELGLLKPRYIFVIPRKWLKKMKPRNNPFGKKSYFIRFTDDGNSKEFLFKSKKTSGNSPDIEKKLNKNRKMFEDPGLKTIK